MTTGNTPAGWYDDPSGQANTERWWDGSAWSGRTRPKSAADTATVSSGTGGGAGQGVPGAFGPAPAVSATPTVVTPAAAPVAPQPFTPTSVVFETVEANTGRRKLLLGVGAVLLSVVMAACSTTSSATGAPTRSSTRRPHGSASPTATADPKSPNGFMGATLTGGQQYPGGKQVTGQESKMNFLLPHRLAGPE